MVRSHQPPPPRQLALAPPVHPARRPPWPGLLRACPADGVPIGRYRLPPPSRPARGRSHRSNPPGRVRRPSRAVATNHPLWPQRPPPRPPAPLVHPARPPARPGRLASCSGCCRLPPPAWPAPVRYPNPAARGRRPRRAAAADHSRQPQRPPPRPPAPLVHPARRPPRPGRLASCSGCRLPPSARSALGPSHRSNPAARGRRPRRDAATDHSQRPHPRQPRLPQPHPRRYRPRAQPSRARHPRRDAATARSRQPPHPRPPAPAPQVCLAACPAVGPVGRCRSPRASRPARGRSRRSTLDALGRHHRRSAAIDRSHRPRPRLRPPALPLWLAGLAACRPRGATSRYRRPWRPALLRTGRRRGPARLAG